MIYCAIFGAALGWLQVHSERHRDLWAFLIHRPLSRSRIFFSKVIAGLCLYALGAVLPLLGMIMAIRMPGHLAAPFEWAMVLPVSVGLLCGIVYYFAGMLTGLRQARWYGSRALGVGVAIVAWIAANNVPEFSRALVLIGLGGAMAGGAAWGSFLSGGYYDGQPPWGRRALVASLMFGSFIVVLLVMLVLESLLPRGSYPWSRYQTTKDGTLYKLTQPAHGVLQITDLAGQPLKDAKTGRAMTLNDFNHQAASEPSVQANFEAAAQPEKAHYRYGDSSRFFTLWRQTPDTLWYWNRNGRLWAYDLASRRFLGSLGPSGFIPGSTAGPDRFSGAEGRGGHGNGYFEQSYPARTLPTDTAVYRLDLENRTATVFFAATNGDRIGGALDIASKDSDWASTFIVTRKSIQLLRPDGKAVWQIPYEPAYPAYDEISYCILDATNKFVVWIQPDGRTNKLSGWTLPAHVAWVVADQGVVHSTNLPSLAAYRGWQELPLTERLVRAVVPPGFLAAPAVLYGIATFREFILWWDVAASVALSVVCAGIGWVLGRRNHFSVGGQCKWAVFHLVFGLPGLLAFCGAQEWPAQEPCAQCKKPRVVDRDHCEFCGADFAPPARNGTEIFEG